MNRSIWFGIFYFIALSFASPALGQTDDETDDQASAAEDDESTAADSLSEELIVTGTRLGVPDPTLRVAVLTYEDLQKRGIITLEEAIRAIPQTLATFANQTSREFGDDTLDENLGAINAIGLSTANLNGFGSKNTLVLLNGKRMAGAAGNENFFVNLRDIPAAAIERIEVHLSGGSSVYGADAVGGVINIITKKDYTGVQFSLHHESSNTGADLTRPGVYLGKSWQGGFVSANLSRNSSKPISNEKLGNTTRNLEPLTGNSQFNFLGDHRLKAAGISPSRWGPFLTLGVGNDGRNALPEDYRPTTPDDYLDLVDKDRAGEVDDKSLIINLQHVIADRFTLQLEYLRTESHTFARYTTFGVSSWLIPSSNAFNNFGTAVYSQYEPYKEIELGLVPPPEQSSRITSQRIALDLGYALGEFSEAKFSFTVGDTESERHQMMIAPREDDEYGDPTTAARIQELFASDDPNVAINFFGDGTGQNATIRELYVPYITSQDSTEIGTIEVSLRSQLPDFGIGPVPILIGYETRPETFMSGIAEFYTGFPEPERDSNAWFVEASFPLVTAENSRPWIKSLLVTVKARYDSHEQEWTNEDNPDGSPKIVTTKFANTSPRLGFAWDINDQFGLIGSWSEGFRAPSSSDMNLGSQVRSFIYTYDPLCGVFGCAPPHPYILRGNADLQPEYSDNYEFGIDWQPLQIPRLQVQLTYNVTDFQDRIASRNELMNLLPIEEFANLPEFFERDEDGNLLRQYGYNINIARRVKQWLVLDIQKYFDLDDRGTLRNRIYVDYVIDMYDQANEGAAKARFVEESIGIDRFSLIGELEWTGGNKSVFVTVDHTPGYLNNEWEANYNFYMIENYDVGSRTVVDASASYEMDNGLLFRIGARNLFNRGFPLSISSSGTPFDARRVDLRRRVLFFDVQYQLGSRD